MPYSELAQTDAARALQEDENGYFEYEWRPLEDILADLAAKGVDISDFDATVEKCKEQLVPEIKKGMVDANTLVEDAQHLAILAYRLTLPPGSGIETQRKVYYGEKSKVRELIE